MRVSALAADQHSAKLLLELLNGTRQRGLRHVAAFGGPREIQGIAQGQIVSDLMKLHVVLDSVRCRGARGAGRRREPRAQDEAGLLAPPRFSPITGWWTARRPGRSVTAR